MYVLPLALAVRSAAGESVCLSVGVCEGVGQGFPPHESVSRAAAEGLRAECVCEAESELESVTLSFVTVTAPELAFT